MINLIEINFINKKSPNYDIQKKYIFFRGKEIIIKGKQNSNLKEFILNTHKKGNWKNHFYINSISKPLKKTYYIKEQYSINSNLISQEKKPKVKISKFIYRKLC